MDTSYNFDKHRGSNFNKTLNNFNFDRMNMQRNTINEVIFEKVIKKIKNYEKDLSTTNP